VALPELLAETLPRDPNLWARTVFPPALHPNEWQTEFLEHFRDPATNRAALRGARGCGKSTVLAMLYLWRATTRPGTLTIASTAVERQMRLGLWAEIRRLWAASDLLRRLYPNWEILVDRIETGDPSWRAINFSSDSPFNIEGAHGRSVAIFIDEARSLADSFYTSLQGIMTGDNSLLVAAGTAGPPRGWWYRVFADGTRDPYGVKFTVRADSVPELRERYERERGRLGESDPIFRQEWEAEFSEGSEWSAFTLAGIEACLDHDPDAPNRLILSHRGNLLHIGGKPAPLTLGCDVARTGDSNVVALIRGKVVAGFRELPHGETMATAGRIVALARDLGASNVGIDRVGLGDGIYGRVAEILGPLGRSVTPFVANERAYDDARYANRKTEVAGEMRQAMERGQLGLPRSDRLVREMLAVQLKQTSRGAVKIEDPPGESPDYLDAVLIGLAAQGDGGVPFAYTPTNW
jgi:hypothetical protein